MQVVKILHQVAQVVLDRIAVDDQQVVIGLLLAMDVVIEDRDGSQDHRQDNDDDAVAEDRLVRALAGIVVFVFGLVVTLIVLFHGANILYKYNKRRGNRCRFVSENRRTSPHVLQI